MSSARNSTALRQAADPVQCVLKGIVARRMHAAVAPFASGHFITPIWGGRLRRGRNSRRDAECGTSRSRLCQQWRRHRAAPSRWRAIQRRPDGPAGPPWPAAGDDHRCRRCGPRRRDQRLLSMLALAGGKLVMIQAIDTVGYAAKSEAQRTRTISLLAQRGRITDRNGTALAFTVEGRAIAARPALFTDDAQRRAGGEHPGRRRRRRADRRRDHGQADVRQDLRLPGPQPDAGAGRRGDGEDHRRCSTTTTSTPSSPSGRTCASTPTGRPRPRWSAAPTTTATGCPASRPSSTPSWPARTASGSSTSTPGT